MIHTKPRKPATSARKKRWVLPVSIFGAACLSIAGGLIWFFGGVAPAEVDLATTASSVADEVESAATTASAAELTDSATDVEGTWVVDTSPGEFTVEDTTTATFVGFRVEEVLNSIGSATAVGRTPDVTGSIAIEGTSLTSAEITADLTSIVSDESRRDDAIQEALNTSSTPEARFVMTGPVELGAEAAEGEVVAVAATGDLTINGVTNEVEIDLDARLIDEMILVTGTTDIAFADYDVTTPTSPIVLSVEDHGTVEIQLWLSR